MTPQRMSSADILRVAQEIEKRGAQLYSRAQKLDVPPEVRMVLERLEADELAHAAQFAAILGESGEDAERPPEITLLLSALAGDIAYPGGMIAEAEAHGFRSAADILRAAIGAEKDSLLFYYSAKEGAPPRLAETLTRLIHEESRHLVLLKELLTNH